jgi:hypothetical protein
MCPATKDDELGGLWFITSNVDKEEFYGRTSNNVTLSSLMVHRTRSVTATVFSQKQCYRVSTELSGVHAAYMDLRENFLVQILGKNRRLSRISCSKENTWKIRLLSSAGLS